MSIEATGRGQPVVFDDDNPEWTEDDFARALRGDDIPAHIRAAFPKMRGRPAGSVKADVKQAVSLRLDPDVLAHFRATGPGWQSRINAYLRGALKENPPAER
ncbi:BrnA antitoxin family protein [Novosphingobium huizhouense]|uniref:BrnA antitoxin family protein n=1 Tax=Novosphingobium huizhouense TaxID=2866625 RepID=UPI001CD88237|nr:BrnA antitoxin family protein [Novosphingobium huizhouense]